MASTDLAVDLELRDRADAVAVDRGAAGEAEAAAVPALADGEHDDVGALVQQAGDIDGVDRGCAPGTTSSRG